MYTVCVTTYNKGISLCMASVDEWQSQATNGLHGDNKCLLSIEKTVYCMYLAVVVCI